MRAQQTFRHRITRTVENTHLHLSVAVHTMADNLKFIVAELNKRLRTDYNLISFDALAAEQLLQVLLDVLLAAGAAPKHTVRDADPADTNQLIVDALKRIQYRAPEPATFRRSLLQADRRTVYPILQYVFENDARIKELIYLAQFLMPLSMPPEAMASPDIAGLWSDYNALMHRFTEMHRGHTEARQFSSKFRELRQDIEIMDLEKENVRKRLEVTQSRLDKIPQHELLLEAANALRVERDRKKELAAQLEEQAQTAQQEQHLGERLQKELSTVRLALHDTTPQQMLDTLLEEAHVIQFMVGQKLPQEIAAKQAEAAVYERVLQLPNITRDYLLDLQLQVDRAADDVRTLVEAEATERGSHSENLVPFRVQAQTVQRNRELAAEQLDHSTKELRDVETRLRQSQTLLDQTVGGLILRGDELKQYVNMLRAKSSVYKQQRAELAAVQAEAADLQQTLDTLRQQDPTLAAAATAAAATDNEAADSMLSLEAAGGGEPAAQRGTSELVRLVDGLTRAVVAARERVAPIMQQTVALRETVADLTEETDAAAQTYNGLKGTFTAEAAIVQSNVSQLTADIGRLEAAWTELQQQHERHAILWQKVSGEGDGGGGQQALRDTFARQLHEQEQQAEQLNKALQHSRSEKGSAQQQLTMWADLHALLDVKLQCMRDARNAGAGGTLMVQQGGAEMFTLDAGSSTNNMV